MPQNPFQQEYKQYGGLFGVNPALLEGIGFRESGHRANAANNWDSNAKAGIPSKGVMQFIQPTFDAFYRQASEARPNVFAKLGAKNWMDPRQQIATTAWAIANGKGSHWATYQDALADAGGKARIPKQWGAGGGVQKGKPGTAGTSSSVSVTPARVVGGVPDQMRNRLASAYERDPRGDLPYVLARLERLNPTRVIPAKLKVTQGTRATAGTPARMQNGLGGFKPKGSVTQQLLALKQRFGLQWDSSAPYASNPQGGSGQHARGSEHYKHRAIDFGDAKNSFESLRRLALWARANKDRVSQLYFNPLGWGISNGQVIKGLTEAGHDDHLHLALRG